MSRTSAAARAGDLPAEQAAVLRTIQQSAARTARLRTSMLSADPDIATAITILGHIEQSTHQRKRAEASAASLGIPTQWIKHARELGHAGHEWSEDQLFARPVPARGRSPTSRLTQHTRQLTEMAAIAAARTHRLTVEGIEWEPAPAAVRQFHANMQAIWACAALRVDVIRLRGRDPGRPWEISDAGWRQLVGRHADAALPSIEEAWRRYADPHIAEQAHNSLTELRRGLNSTAMPHSAADWEKPPSPDALIVRAQNALHMVLRERLYDEGSRTRPARGAVPPIRSAITDIMPATGNHAWYAAPHLSTSPAPAAEPQRDLGVDR
ncbi:hypothetical protein [Nocardia sp. NPDC047648]|uniref:hypothetical protein n=1 Tax=Nocardia sp. NPDC047648 TaxID=3155625 RepID=UPI0033CD9354